jgi:hypothetical protein
MACNQINLPPRSDESTPDTLNPWITLVVWMGILRAYFHEFIGTTAIGWSEWLIPVGVRIRVTLVEDGRETYRWLNKNSDGAGL